MVRWYVKAGTEEPQLQTPERPSKLDLYADKLAAWLMTRSASRGSSGEL